MKLDHTNIESISYTTHQVAGHLLSLRALLQRRKASCLAMSNPVMHVRLHCDERGELWYNTGDPKYDTQLGVARHEVTMRALDPDERVNDLASILVGAVVEQLAQSGRPIRVQMQMERARQRGDWAEWRRLARSNEARK